MTEPPTTTTRSRSARMLGSGALSISLAYVRHSVEYDPAREEIAAHDANGAWS